MFAEQRQEKILHLLEEYKQVEVGSLTTILSASEATVRRDLEKLERMGLLHRTHGGAILAEEKTSFLQAVKKKSSLFDEEVNAVGRTAASVIAEHEVVAIGSGGLGHALASNLDPALHCTIVTNDALIMTELLNHQQVNVIMVGGLARKAADDAVFTSGESTIRMLGEFHVAKAFLSVDGISLDAGLTSRDFEYALIWKKIREIADETVILATSAAFDRRELVRLAPIDEVGRLVTGAGISDSYKKFFYDNSIPVHISFDL